MRLQFKNIIHLVLIILILINSFGCRKYLAEKQNQALVIPGTVADLQALLDAFNVVNNSDPGAGEFSADDYYLGNSEWASLTEYYQRIYTWEKDNLFRPGNANDWAYVYPIVYKANIVLDNIDKIKRTPGDEAEWSNTKGSALFLRGRVFSQLAWIWALSYDKATASSDLGIPLRLSSEFNSVSKRSSLQATYDQIIRDMKEAIALLPAVPEHVMRPSKPAACAWLARVYLSMREYDSAFVYADKCLQLYNTLVDYNSLIPVSYPPIKSFNKEVIYHAALIQPFGSPDAKVDSTLYEMYAINDLRKEVFFYHISGREYGFQGSYDGSNWESQFFGGVATDEVYLTRAECYARKGNTNEAISDLNTLMIFRWRNDGSFVPFTATNSNDALKKILIERRKELLNRGIRWMDIKRLNKEGANIVLKRQLNNQVYTLPANDPKYALPIPEDVISISGMQQNPR